LLFQNLFYAFDDSIQILIKKHVNNNEFGGIFCSFAKMVTNTQKKVKQKSNFKMDC